MSSKTKYLLISVLIGIIASAPTLIDFPSTLENMGFMLYILIILLPLSFLAIPGTSLAHYIFSQNPESISAILVVFTTNIVFYIFLGFLFYLRKQQKLTKKQ